MSDDMQAPAAGESPAAGGEYERECVPKQARMGFKNFLGMYAGEHTAGTELMIGPLFVLAGVAAFDVVMGLLIGDALAVLSWLLLTAPIATRVRLTLYYQLERIAGRYTVILYNLANGMAFCFLAGAMITVSATAVGVWFGFPLPTLSDLVPNSLGWVLSVLGVGLVITLVAAYGYRFVSWFANIAAPWMVLIFLGFGIVSLKWFLDATGSEVGSTADLWPLADQALGVAGLICVIIAGWTTANPTIYRAGLGLRSFYAESAGRRITYPVLGTWLITLAICLALVEFAGIEIFFVALPGWFIAAALFIAFSFMAQRANSRRHAGEMLASGRAPHIASTASGKE